MIHILVVEDDVNLNFFICKFLNNHGYETKGCLSAKEATLEMYNNLYDLVLSDIMMSEIDGFEFAESIRRVNKNLPIIFMTARDDLSSKQRGFKIGIDDYMVKPIDPIELDLRIKAILRRYQIVQDKQLTVGNLTMDVEAMAVTVTGEEIPVTVREFNILFKLLSYPNKSFTRNYLMDEFWGLDSNTSLRAVDIYIAKLREKFSQCIGFKIVTIHGLGYKAVLQ
ncbi:MAG: response regulator transcription factor [Spirochaetales bacterium]|nr:response regulator transcription factor [Spirochaetales bacterium]